MELIEARYHDDSNLNGIQEAGEKRQACISKIEPVRFPNRLYVAHRRKRVVSGWGALRFSV